MRYELESGDFPFHFNESQFFYVQDWRLLSIFAFFGAKKQFVKVKTFFDFFVRPLKMNLLLLESPQALKWKSSQFRLKNHRKPNWSNSFESFLNLSSFVTFSVPIATCNNLMFFHRFQQLTFPPTAFAIVVRMLDEGAQFISSHSIIMKNRDRMWPGGWEAEKNAKHDSRNDGKNIENSYIHTHLVINWKLRWEILCFFALRCSHTFHNEAT